jgi:hypothetical protein
MASNSQVAHVWAQQRKPSMSGSNFYFDGSTIFSYGRHFPIAKFVERKGKKAVLFTTRSYSSSTSKHISYTRRALQGLNVPVFHVCNPTMPVTSPEVRKYFQGRLDIAVDEIAKARMSVTRLRYIEQANGICAAANVMAEWFGFRWRMVTPEWGEAYIQRLRDKAKEVERKKEAKLEQQRKANEKRHAEQLVELAKRRERWLAGEDVQLEPRWYSGTDVPTVLRVKGDKVETSRGAEIPLPHAKRLWPAIRKVMQSGAPYEHNGHSIHVGEFRIDRIEVDGTLIAGCHTIKYPELERIAKQLGLVGEVSHAA